MTDLSVLAHQGINAMSEWHSGEGLTPADNELLTALTAAITDTASTANWSQPQVVLDQANLVKCCVVAAYQIGRASAALARDT